MIDCSVKRCNPRNYGGKRDISAVKWIVIHYTANRGDTAKNNADYFAREKTYASAHYFVDESEVWESVPIEHIAWHCGGGLQGEEGGSLFGTVKNVNSIGVEICMLDKSGDVRYHSIRKAARFVRRLMETYQIPLSNVVRHWDVTGKECPGKMIGASPLWIDFRDMLKEEEMTKEQFESMHQQLEKQTAAKNQSAWAAAAWEKATKAGIVDGTSPQSPLTREQFCVILQRLGLIGK